MLWLRPENTMGTLTLMGFTCVAGPGGDSALSHAGLFCAVSKLCPLMALLHSSLCWRASSHPSSSHCTDEPLEVGMYPPGFWTGCKSHGNIYEHLWGCFLRKWHRGAIKPCHISFSCLPRAVDPGEAACEAEFCFQEVKTGKVSKLYSKQLMELFLLLN